MLLINDDAAITVLRDILLEIQLSRTTRQRVLSLSLPE
jgi:hypothetical protein